MQLSVEIHNPFKKRLEFYSVTIVRNIKDNRSEKDLILDFRKRNDLKVLGDLYKPYMDLVYGVCLKYLQQPEDAKDAVINIFEELASKLQKHEVANFRGWLYQVAKNHCLMKLRSDKKYPVTVQPEFVHLSVNGHQEYAKQKELDLTAMEGCLQRLPEEQKIAVTRFYLEEKSYREISIETNTNIEKVRSYIQNGRRNLKICMEKTAAKTAL